MLDCKQDYKIENDWVQLKPLSDSDYDSLLVYAENEADIWQYNAFGPIGAAGLSQYIQTALKNRASGIDYPFVVIDKKSNTAVGSTRYYAINARNKTLEIGFTWYGKQFQGTYINKNCKYLLLEFAFETLRVERIGFRANSKNSRSIQAMKNIGCVEEGVLRNFAVDAIGNRIDATVLSIIQPEWFSHVKQNLLSKITLK